MKKAGIWILAGLLAVAFAVPLAASADNRQDLKVIKRAIREHDLNRVVVASCTPRTNEPLFRSACVEEGLNKYLFEFVNIRDQCSWVHMRLPKEATEKAKALVRMGVAKARLLEPLGADWTGDT